MKPEDLLQHPDQEISLLEHDGTEWCKAILDCEEFAFRGKAEILCYVVVPKDARYGDASGLDWPLSDERVAEIQFVDGQLSLKLPKQVVVHDEIVP